MAAALLVAVLSACTPTPSTPAKGEPWSLPARFLGYELGGGGSIAPTAAGGAWVSVTYSNMDAKRFRVLHVRGGEGTTPEAELRGALIGQETGSFSEGGVICGRTESLMVCATGHRQGALSVASTASGAELSDLATVTRELESRVG